MIGMTQRPVAHLILVLTLLALAGWSSPALAQGASWTQCVARSPTSGTLYVGEAVDKAERGKAALYRAEFIKAGQASGIAEAELSAQNAFCFFAPRQADLVRMVSDLGKPCPSCSAPYRQAPLAWDVRDILPPEIAATSSHLAILALAEPPPPEPPQPPSPTGEVVPAPLPPEPKPTASARWQAFLCGTDVRMSYAFEAPGDSPVESAPFKGVVVAGGGIERSFEETLAKTANAVPSCASPTFMKVASLAEFSRDLPTRGEARVAALRQRLDSLSVQVILPPPPPLPAAVVAEVAPSGKPAAKKPPATVVAVAPPARPVTPRPVPVPVLATAIVAPPVPTATPKASLPPVAADQVTALLNADVARRNAEVEARNAVAAADYEKRMAAYKAAQDAFAASQATYERNNKAHEAQVAEAARQRTAWEAKVKACNAGDRTACSQ